MGKRVFDLEAMFHKETGMYVNNHQKEYLRWLEGNLSRELNKNEVLNELSMSDNE